MQVVATGYRALQRQGLCLLVPNRTKFVQSYLRTRGFCEFNFHVQVALEIAVGQRSPITLAVFVDAGSTPTLPGTTCAAPWQEQ